MRMFVGDVGVGIHSGTEDAALLLEELGSTV